MKAVKGILIGLAIIFMLFLGIVAPVSLIGMIIFIVGLVLKNRSRNRKNRFGWVIAAGLLSSFVLAMMFSTPPEETNEAGQQKTASVKQEKEEAAAKKAKEKAEAEAKAEEARKAEEKARAEEQAKIEEQARAEQEDKEKQEAAKTSQKELAKSMGLELITVGRVVDGDTFVTSDGRKVRLVGVNTPESTTRHEEYGKEASNYTTSKLNGKQVWIQKDVSETDRYSRLLRIVWLSVPANDMDENEIRSKMFNADLVLNGYAEPSTYPPDVKYSEYFVKFAREAREANKGLWAFGEQGTTKGDLDSSSGSTSGGNTSGGSTPDSGSSNAGKESFKNCTEMRKVYPDGVPSTHPAYESRHDRDKDNWACE